MQQNSSKVKVFQYDAVYIELQYLYESELNKVEFNKRAHAGRAIKRAMWEALGLKWESGAVPRMDALSQDLAQKALVWLKEEKLRRMILGE